MCCHPCVLTEESCTPHPTGNVDHRGQLCVVVKVVLSNGGTGRLESGEVTVSLFLRGGGTVIVSKEDDLPDIQHNQVDDRCETTVTNVVSLLFQCP